MTTYKMYQTKCGHSQFVDLNSEFKDLQKFAIEPKGITLIIIQITRFM
jgi:hypothetical protein